MLKEMTDTCLKLEGMNVLIKNLGAVNAERFIALMSYEPFDYTKWRQDNLEEDNVGNLSHKAMNYSMALNSAMQERAAAPVLNF